MRPGARLAAAIDIVQEILERHRPAPLVLADWGRTHRFAGSGDRAALGNLVYDVLRRKSSLAAQMGDDSPRALILAAAGRALALSPDAVAGAADGSPHALSQLNEAELSGLTRKVAASEPDWVRGNYPEWLQPAFASMFGERAAKEGAGLAVRAPIDLRVNTLKADRARVLKALARFSPTETPLSPLGIRVPAPQGPAKTARVEAEAGHGRGWFEVQDEGSQIAALLAGASARAQVADICAGSGGKTLAFAAAMQNTGQIHAYDADPMRLRPIFERLKRAGARNVQTLRAGDSAALGTLAERMDTVVIDAPCSGSGVWRRRPDAKWRLRPEHLVERISEQRAVLDTAATLVKPGGRLVYITCSILAEENTGQISDFLARTAGFTPVPYREAWRSHLPGEPPQTASEPRSSGGTQGDHLLLTPAQHGTDGFFIATLKRVDAA